jgi:hypothetical protein
VVMKDGELSVAKRNEMERCVGEWNHWYVVCLRMYVRGPTESLIGQRWTAHSAPHKLVIYIFTTIQRSPAHNPQLAHLYACLIALAGDS